MIIPPKYHLSAAFSLICRNLRKNSRLNISHQTLVHASSSCQKATALTFLHTGNSHSNTIHLKHYEPLTVLWPLVRRRKSVPAPTHLPSSHFHTLNLIKFRPEVLVEKFSAGLVVLRVRYKSKKKQYDSGEETDSDFDDNLDEDDFEAPSHFKVQTIHAPSLRIDAVLSKALGLSRHRLEEIFFGPGILLNGKKLLKKGGKMDEGDYVDVVMEKAGDQVRVKRVKLLQVSSQRTNTDKLTLRVRVWKAPFSVQNPDRWRSDS